jgi:hypothetical protein
MARFLDFLVCLVFLEVVKDFYRPALAHSADHNFVDNLPVNLTVGKF